MKYKLRIRFETGEEIDVEESKVGDLLYFLSEIESCIKAIKLKLENEIKSKSV